MSFFGKEELPIEVTSIIANFDFKSVRRVMEALDWEWREEGIPSISSLIGCAESLLTRVYNETEPMSSSSGGFCARTNGDKKLILDFIVESKDSEYSQLLMD